MEENFKIGYIDEDYNQVRLYQRKLRNLGFDVIGYNIQKGMTLDDIMEQVYESDIDLLLIDFKLNETNVVPFNGDSIEREIYNNKPLFPHIIFTNKVDQARPDVDDLKIIFDKEIVFTEDGEEDDDNALNFKNVLIKSIQQYKSYIKKRKDRISDLIRKEENEGLDASEKNELLREQRELFLLDKKNISAVPESLISVDKLEIINKARIEAQEFIDSLMKK